MDYKDFNRFLELVTNPEKAAAVLKELTEKEQTLRIIAEQLGDLSQAAELKKQAAEVLETAKADAEKIKAEAIAAEEKSKAVAEEAHRVANNAQKKANDTLQKAKDLEALANAKQAENSLKEKELAKSAALLAAQREEFVKNKAELDERLSKLRSVMS